MSTVTGIIAAILLFIFFGIAHQPKVTSADAKKARTPAAPEPHEAPALYTLKAADVQKGDHIALDNDNIGQIIGAALWFEHQVRLRWKIVYGPNLAERGEAMYKEDDLLTMVRRLPKS